MIKLCVFDLDGTLLNTSYALQRCINAALAEMGVGEIDLEHTKGFVGDGYRTYVRRSLEYLGIEEEEEWERACRIYERVVEEHKMYQVKPYEGILSMLEALKKRGLKLAVLSNKVQEVVEDNCAMFFAENLFDRIYGERQGIRIKPSPEALLALMEELQVSKEEVLYFGDTDVDMKTAVNAGVCGIGVLWGFRDKEELQENGAVYLVQRPGDIVELADEHC